MVAHSSVCLWLPRRPCPWIRWPMEMLLKLFRNLVLRGGGLVHIPVDPFIPALLYFLLSFGPSRLDTFSTDYVLELLGGIEQRLRGRLGLSLDFSGCLDETLTQLIIAGLIAITNNTRLFWDLVKDLKLLTLRPPKFLLKCKLDGSGH